VRGSLYWELWSNPSKKANFRSKVDFFQLRLIRCRDAWKDERIKHEMKRAHLWQDIRPSYFGPGLRQNLTVSGKKGLGLTSYGLGFFGVVPGRPPTEAPPWRGYSIFVKWVIQIVGDPHHTGSCPALVSELFKNRLSPLASKQASKQNEKSDFFVPAITPTPGGAPTRLGYGYILDIVRLHAHAYWRCPGLGCLGTQILNFEVQQNS